MEITTPKLPDNNSGGGTIAIIFLALAITGGVLYWKFGRDDQSNSKN